MALPFVHVLLETTLRVLVRTNCSRRADYMMPKRAGMGRTVSITFLEEPWELTIDSTIVRPLAGSHHALSTPTSVTAASMLWQLEMQFYAVVLRTLTRYVGSLWQVF